MKYRLATCYARFFSRYTSQQNKAAPIDCSMFTPNSSDKKRVATSPLDEFDLKKSRTLSGDCSTSEKMEITLDDSQIEKIVNVLQGSLESKLTDMISAIVNNVLDGVNSKMSTIHDENKVLKDRVEQLEKKIEQLEKQGDTANQYSRRNCLRVSGIKESDGESMDEIVKCLSYELKADIDLSDIDNVHRLHRKKVRSDGSSSGQSNKSADQRPRDIIIKFTTYRARQQMFSRRSELKHSKVFERVFINEELTRLRGEVFYNARRLVKSKHLKSAWTSNGVILVKDNSDVVHRCEFKNDLTKFN